jgi:sulfur-oxidizing protein SoxZ
VEATHNGKTVLKATWSAAVSQNPFLSFKFKGANKGDKVVVKWTDSKGESRTDEASVS